MSKIEVDAIEPQSGTSLTLGASGDTLTIPSGATLVNNGTASGFGDNLEWQSSIVTAATITVTANKGYWIDTTSNACTITLPAAAAVGDRLIFTDYARNWATNAVTINPNSLNFQGGTTNPVYDTNGQSVDIVYSGATKGWIPNSDDDVADEGNPPPYSVDFLAIAGGGSGGSNYGGGGGAGGYRNSFGSEASGGGGSSEASLSFFIGTTYTITVGSGGTSVSGPYTSGNTGVNSSISGSDITTITSLGGGAGGNRISNGGSGGSGGGPGDNYPGGYGVAGTGTANQGYNSGNTLSHVAYYGAGGGGAGAVGVNGGSGATGGAGVASSITGSAVTRAGGGGGGNHSGGGGGAGGAGGGGTGGGPSPATSGTVNTGSGGGGGADSQPISGAGGSGVVILSMPLANFSGTTTGSPTESDNGTTKRLIFNGDGSYTG